MVYIIFYIFPVYYFYTAYNDKLLYTINNKLDDDTLNKVLKDLSIKKYNYTINDEPSEQDIAVILNLCISVVVIELYSFVFNLSTKSFPLLAFSI